MNMTLSEFLANNNIVKNYNGVEYRLIDHEDYSKWSDSDHFPGFVAAIYVEENNLTIVPDDGDIQSVGLDTMGEENDNPDGDGYGFVFTNASGERVKLVFCDVEDE